MLKLVLCRFSGAQIKPFLDVFFSDDPCQVIEARQAAIRPRTLGVHFRTHAVWRVLVGPCDLGAWSERGRGHQDCPLGNL